MAAAAAAAAVLLLVLQLLAGAVGFLRPAHTVHRGLSNSYFRAGYPALPAETAAVFGTAGCVAGGHLVESPLLRTP